ncbi:hypothetical protein PR048_003056 [Dryococelus australis]|uniref:Uncharacterized protein n=1 Tax=Dryococelus australis TaxID=614101 RepID=A0ABQ9ILZ1_9NEOP|nr:hypothetical protein PR048_003056 [Dryococelus australis]
MEQHRNARAVEAGDPRENPPTSGIVRHDPHMRRSGATPPGIEAGSPRWEARSLTTTPCGGPPKNKRCNVGGVPGEPSRRCQEWFETTDVEYTQLLMWPHGKKSASVRSGDLGGHDTRAPLPIHLTPNVSMNTTVEMRRGAIMLKPNVFNNLFVECANPRFNRKLLLPSLVKHDSSVNNTHDANSGSAVHCYVNHFVIRMWDSEVNWSKSLHNRLSPSLAINDRQQACDTSAAECRPPRRADLFYKDAWSLNGASTDVRSLPKLSFSGTSTDVTNVQLKRRSGSTRCCLDGLYTRATSRNDYIVVITITHDDEAFHSRLWTGPFAAATSVRGEVSAVPATHLRPGSIGQVLGGGGWIACARVGVGAQRRLLIPRGCTAGNPPRESAAADRYSPAARACTFAGRLHRGLLRGDEGETRRIRSSVGMQRQGKREIPEKTRRTTASSGTIPICENPGVTPPGIKPSALATKPTVTITSLNAVHNKVRTLEMNLRKKVPAPACIYFNGRTEKHLPPFVLRVAGGMFLGVGEIASETVKLHYLPKRNWAPVHNVFSVVVTPLESRRATSRGYNSIHPAWHALYECLQDIHGDSSPFLLQPFHELSNGFWMRVTSPRTAIQFVPKMCYRVEVGALGGPVQSANIVVCTPSRIVPEKTAFGQPALLRTDMQAPLLSRKEISYTVGLRTPNRTERKVPATPCESALIELLSTIEKPCPFMNDNGGD